MPLPWERDWAELPMYLLLHILHKLEDHVELLLGGAAGTCHSWRHAARGEPELWRHIDMRGQHVPTFSSAVSLKMMARAALQLSAGHCESFAAKGDVNNDLLLFLAEQAPLLKRLRLISCHDVSNEAFAEAIQKFPLLEELELSYCTHISNHGVLKLVAKACPEMEHLKYVKSTYNRMHEACHTTKEEALAIAGMHNLWSLDLSSGAMSNEALTTILDNCPYLEYLNIRGRLIDMDDILRAKCAQVNMNDYEHFQRSNPVRYRYPYSFGGSGYPIYDEDPDAASYYLGTHVSDFELEEHESILDSKYMRRYVSLWNG